ncbi:MAG TPA: ABC transporter ATP-binding protein [Methylomirabilota bacterium]|jgi:putative spermidine/putrescine transport system ATP-binding protein|nr:ABC transporter ATP-binding protein [Methylomirabilota bacterium]
MTASTLALQDVAFAYPGSAFRIEGLDLSVAPGELVAVIGASGSGKSTVLKLAAGFLAPAHGRVVIDGADVTDAPPRMRELGIVFQAYALFPHMTALENVAYPLKVRGVDQRDRRDQAMRMLEIVGLAHLAGRRPDQLSGGQQQRVALARALVFRPRALLLDEPLSALDAALRGEMRDEIRRLQREHAIATLHVTHDQEEALSMADRVVVMRDGRIEQAGTPRQLYDTPRTRSVASFVGRANLWDGVVRDAAVDTPIGLLHAAALRLPPSGTRVTVLVRPENVRLGAAPDSINTFRGRLTRDRFLGATRRYDLEVLGGTIVGETSQPDAIDVVHIPPERVQVITDQ